MAEMSTRWLAGLALLALIPVLAFLLVEGQLVVLLAAVNVCLFTYVLYTFFGPASRSHSTN
ncbi:hypothetical protein [Halocalculus aciditolerans]|uniref:hypothetical protein n=1 Tax=Halocalculus aciditolerans TaxID=1383812 RepID=UPI00166E18D8|nr:hypothetical protein [Halocalculus aciditolerans]